MASVCGLSVRTTNLCSVRTQAGRAEVKKLSGGVRTGVRHPTLSDNFCAYLTTENMPICII